MEPWQFPTVLPQQYSEYMTADWSNIVTWVTSLHEPEGSPRRWSWFQLYLDFQQRYPSGGPWYHQGTKHGRISQTRPKSTFLKQVRWFNSYIAKIGQLVVDKMPINLQIPDSCYISFRTKTLPVSVTDGRHISVENLLGQWSTCFSTPKELEDVLGG